MNVEKVSAYLASLRKGRDMTQQQVAEYPTRPSASGNPARGCRTSPPCRRWRHCTA